MKLLYITNAINGSGGLERVLSIKATYLSDVLGYEVHIIVLNQGDAPLFYTFSSKIIIHDINVVGNPFKYFYLYSKGIKNIVSKVKPEVISVCDDGLKGFFIPIILNNNQKIIYERHASVNLNFNKNSLKKGLFTRLKHRILQHVMQNRAKSFDRFVVLTKGNLKEWNSNNVEVIPNPLSFFSNELNNYNSKRVIAVGSHSYNKGYDLLLNSWSKVVQKYPDWVLDIYGKKDALETYVKLSKVLSLEQNVIFHNPVPDIEKKYLEASIMVLPSRSEGFGMVLIEAMACGLPCVSFNCPHGPGDIIKNNEDGFLIENGNMEEFAEKLLLLIDDKELRVAMGTKAKINAKLYLPENIMNKWAHLFEFLIKNKKN
jgi:glycosyltransferase involved in cell wall biosynthesis